MPFKRVEQLRQPLRPAGSGAGRCVPCAVFRPRVMTAVLLITPWCESSIDAGGTQSGAGSRYAPTIGN